MPQTATDLPGLTCATLNTAPKPVGTQQPMKHAWSRGKSSRILMAPSSGRTMYSAKPATKVWWFSRSPFASVSRDVPSQSPPVGCLAWLVLQMCPRPLVHMSHLPHAIIHVATTWSPGLTEVTPGPTSCTMPAAS